MLTQMYRSEFVLVIWLLFGFEEVIVQCPSYRQGMSIGTYADYRHCTDLAGCLYGVIFNTLLLCNRDITDGAHPVRILNTILF